MEIVRVGGIRSDFIADTVGDGRFIQKMFLIAFVSVNRTYVGHGGAVEAGRGHGEAAVK